MVTSELCCASRHNLVYWGSRDWQGLDPGAHSYTDRYHWWNLKHPRACTSRVPAGTSPAAAGEILDADSRSLEKIIPAVYTTEGFAVMSIPNPQAINDLNTEGPIEKEAVLDPRIVLTLRGRFLVGAVTRQLMGFQRRHLTTLSASRMGDVSPARHLANRHRSELRQPCHKAASQLAPNGS